MHARAPLMHERSPVINDVREAFAIHDHFDLHVGARGARLFDPSQDRLLIQAVTAREIKRDSIGLRLAMSKSEAQQREARNDDDAFHKHSSVPCVSKIGSLGLRLRPTTV